jgi:protein tyrosine/serine phosphatase
MNLFRNSDADHETPKVKKTWDLSDPAERRRAAWKVELEDHAFLRRLWSNLSEIAPGVWRANHPNHAQLARYSDMGIKTILNLRGTAKHPRFLFEQESCAAMGLTLVSVGLRARKAPEKHEVLALFDAFNTMEKPFLMHCKSGADRAGFASALYLLREGAPVAKARRQLHWRFLHFRRGETGILDHILDLFEQDHLKTGIGIEAWFRDRYDPAVIQSGFRK